ncbi:hypothetical protein [Leifsonia poae]|uniref:hypothetical protein n=1 Tax=Leifsonia poae TaxID=110933 RepID=UPI003D677249
MTMASSQSARSIVTATGRAIGSLLARIARILMIVVGGMNGGRSADESARSLYEAKKDYRP